MRAKTKYADGTPREPRIDYIGIGESDDYDFFPHLKGHGAADRDVIKSLKNGTYQPYMQTHEYKADFDVKKNLFSAELIDDNIITRPKYTEFSASMAGEEKKRIEQLQDLHDRSTPVQRRYYANPRQYYDHILLADGYTNSFAGTVLDTWVDFVLPRGLRPVLKLRHPSRDKKADQKKIEKNQDIIDELNLIDLWYSDNGPTANDPYFDVSLHQKFKSAFKAREVFGRCALVKENWKEYDPVKVGNNEYKNLPNTIKQLETVGMGLTEIDAYTGKVAGVWISNNRPYIPAEDMIYLVNDYGTPQIGAASYGFSKLQRSMDQVRLYRRLVARNFPQFLRVSASGMGVFVVNTTSYDEETRKKIRAALRNTHKPSEIGVIDYANVDDFAWHEFKIQTDIDALVKMEQMLLMSIANVIGVPQSIILDAGSPARATLVGRILTFMNGPVAQARLTFGEQLSNQWYMPIFREIAGKEIKEEFYITTEFIDAPLETKEERIDRLLKESILNQYTDEHIGEELEDPDYEKHIDQDKIREMKELQKATLQNNGPGGQGGQGGPGGPGGKGGKKPGGGDKTMGVNRDSLKQKTFAN